MDKEYHRAVLLRESIDALRVQESGVYVDATYGGGGHSKEILSRLGEQGVLIAFDQDADAWESATEDSRLRRVQANFRFLRQYVRFHGKGKVDGILADLGVSSHQFDTGERGFSTRFKGPLDMRMNAESDLRAADVVNTYTERDLSRILREYGELGQARGIAAAIVRCREAREIRQTDELLDAVSRFLVRGKENKIAARIFQALRIEVNKELEALEEFLRQSAEILKVEGRLVVISYHSLEDRLVKRFMRDGRFDGKVADKDMYGRSYVPFRKCGGPVRPGEKEMKTNPRSRSAILRVAQRTEHDND